MVGEKRPDGSNYGADAVITVIRYIVSPIVFIREEEEARFTSSDLGPGKARNPALGPEKLNSPQAYELHEQHNRYGERDNGERGPSQ